MSNVIPFDFEKHNVRVILIDGVPSSPIAELPQSIPSDR